MTTLFSALLVACASTPPGRDAACGDALAMMDSLCAGELGEDGRDLLNVPRVRGHMCVEMADGLRAGRCGGPRDEARAARYYEHACARGYQVACRAEAR